MPELAEKLISEYYSSGATIAELAKKHGISSGKAYYIMRDSGCKFSRKRRKPYTEQERQHMRTMAKGHRMSDEQKRIISERNSCNWNGLNGYGHTKAHNRGYILAYAPKHPHAHKDGYIMLHTIIMERHIGRYLEKNEVVHHINHDRKDNRLENLQLMDKHEHCVMHMLERKRG